MLVSIKLDVEVHLFLGEIIQLPLKGGVPTEWGQQHRHPRPASNHPAKEPLPAGKKSAWSAPWTQRNYCLSSRCESVGKPQRTATPAWMKKNKGSYLKSICVLENKCSSPPITNRNIHSYNSSGVSRKSWCWLLTLNFFWKIFTNKSDLQETIFFFLYLLD